ncbi:MAG: HDIG domain-containing protein [Deltaproteobacteria bacterium]|nr:HDIG domain-containing protein [Candidatus Zymogenaceae bacterium]
MNEIPLDTVIPRYERVKSAIPAAGSSVYLVGGAVRDFLLGRPSYDFDFIVFGDPESFARRVSTTLGGRLVVLDERERIYRVVCRGVEYDFSAPKGPDLPSDLAMRDFTINALAANVSLSPSPVTGLPGGQDDLATGVIRAASDAAFTHDPLRLLRAFRFKAVLGFSLDEQTRQQIVLRHGLITSCARERIRDEWARLLSSPHAFGAVRGMDETGLLETIFPEISAMKGVEQNRWHSWDVWGHCMATMQEMETVIDDLDRFFPGRAGELTDYLKEPLGAGWTRGSFAKLVALVHDVGKPETRTVREDDQASFYGHENVGAEIFLRLGRRILLGKKAARFGRLLIKNHMRLLSLAVSQQVTKRAVARLFRDTGDALPALLILGLADTRAGRQDPARENESLDVIDEVFSVVDEIKTRVTPLLTGTEIMRLCSIPEGKIVGTLKSELADAQAVGTVTTKAEARGFVRERIKNHETVA